MADFPSSSLANCEEGQSPVEVCTFCGDKGFEHTLIECSQCSETLVHQYCLGIPPGDIDDDFVWICEFCKPSTKRKKKKKKKRKIHPCLPHGESPLTLGSKCKRIRKEKTEDESFSSPTKVSIAESSNTKDNINTNSLDCSSSCMVYCDGTKHIMPLDYDERAATPIPKEEQLEPLPTILPIRTSKKTKFETNNKLLVCWEDSEGGISSLMENPKEITRGVVLLATPYGEIFIDEGSIFRDEDMSLYVQPLDTYFDEEQIGAEFCSLETDTLDTPRSKKEKSKKI